MNEPTVFRGTPNEQREQNWLSGAQRYNHDQDWDYEQVVFAPPHVTEKEATICGFCGEHFIHCPGVAWNGLWPADTCGCEAMWMLSNPADTQGSFTMCSACAAVLIATDEELQAFANRPPPLQLQCAGCGTDHPGTIIRICGRIVCCNTCWQIPEAQKLVQSLAAVYTDDPAFLSSVLPQHL